VSKWLLRGLAVSFLLLVLTGVAVLVVLPRATHGTALSVLTGSMSPDIPVGSLVLDRPVDTRSLHVGDIATYQEAPGENIYITHRIVAINTTPTGTTFTFKGDANRGPDVNAVPAAAVRGKVWFHVPYLGTVRDTLESGGGRMLVLALVVFGLAGYAVSQLRSALRKDGDTGAPLTLAFPLDAFGDVDPTFVADLLHGDCDVTREGFTLSFAASPERRAVIRELLAPYTMEVIAGPDAATDPSQAPSSVQRAVDAAGDYAGGYALAR
jgi:signal peptidase I